MARPWFPFYVGDYVRDTARLTTEAHGAYLLLMLDYWVNGAPPDDDETLATITKLPVSTWKKRRPTLVKFFNVKDGVWTHGRIEKEKAKADTVGAANSDKAREAAERRWAKEREHKVGGQQQAQSSDAPSMRVDAPSIDGALPQNAQPQPQPQPQNIGGGVERGREADEARKRGPMISEEAFALSGDVLEAMGRDREDPLSVGAPMTVQVWLNGGWPAEVILVGVQKAMANRKHDPPSTLKYFEKAIARSHAEFTRVLPKAEIQNGETFKVNHGTSRSTSGNSILAAIDRAIAAEQGAQDSDFAVSARPVLRISN